MIIDEKTTYIDKDVIIGSNVTIYPNVTIRGKSVIGDNTVIDSNTIIIDSVIGCDNYIISSVIEKMNNIGNNNKIGPFSHLRENNKIGDNNIIGSYVEISNSIIGNNNHSKHLTYIGNVTLSNNVNIGAGVVFANYHSKKKLKSNSFVFDDVSIGSNSTIVAPVKIDNKSMIGAGSVVCRDIDCESLYINRRNEVYKKGYYGEEDII